MTRHVFPLLTAVVAASFVGAWTEHAHADCVDTPVTITFDAGSGTPHCYTESGLTVCASKISPPTDGTLTLGDNDGNTSPDLSNQGDADGLVYTFSMGGQPFAVTSFDFAADPGNGDPGTFRSFKGGDVQDFIQPDNGVVTPDPAYWSGLTSVTWTLLGPQPGPNVLDNLAIVVQCCGNGTVDSGELCDDGNTLDGDCCSSTCQFEASGSFCPADYDFCTSDVCDGAGSCTHPSIPNCNATRPCGPTRPAGNPLFERPAKAGKFQSDLVQAFIVCGDVGGNTPDRTSEGAVPACQVETPNERDGSPMNGWKWDESRGQGTVQMKATCHGADDIAIKIKMKGILDGANAPASGNGTFSATWRATVNDPTGGDMTTIDLTSSIPFPLLNGNGGLVTTAGVMLSESGMPDLPNGSGFELLNAELRDPNGNAFATPGLFLLR
ncbi:MAG TPA: hypothetical protein VGK30_10280 [Candidatus Binatia bacterium]